MIPVDQTITDFENGDCVRACVASIFELSIHAVPNFMRDGPSKFLEYFDTWCGMMGVVALDLILSDDAKDLMKNTYMIANGKSPRRKKESHQHAVVWYDGKMVHDPIPLLSPAHRKQKEMGLDGEPENYTVFVVKNPVDMKD